MKEIIKKVPPPGFEPGSRAFLVPPVGGGARKARILGRAILRRLILGYDFLLRAFSGIFFINCEGFIFLVSKPIYRFDYDLINLYLGYY